MPNVSPIYLDKSFLGSNSLQGLYFDMMPSSFASNIFNGYGLDWAQTSLINTSNIFSNPVPSNYQSNPFAMGLQGLTSPEQIMNIPMPQCQNNPSINSEMWGDFDIINLGSIQQSNSSNIFNNFNITPTQIQIGLIPEINNSKLFNNKDKKELAKLPELTQKKVLELKKEANKQGYDFTIESGYRSLEKQALFKKAWDTNDTKTLNKYGIVAKPAKAGYSYHNFGYAIDFKATKGSLSQIGKLAESMGWTWGGRFGDSPHIDLRNQLNGETLASLRQKSGLPS